MSAGAITAFERIGDPSSTLPLSARQRAAWLDSRLFPESRYHRVVSTVELRGALDTARLQRAWAETTAAVEALRVVVDVAEPRQRVAAARDVPPLPIVSVAPEGLTAWIAARAVAGGLPDPCDAALLAIDERRHVLYFRSDGVALDPAGHRLVIERLAAHYAGHAFPSAGSLADFLRDEAEYSSSPRAGVDGAYWSRKLAGAAPGGRPYGLSRVERSAATTRVYRTIGDEHSRALAGLARSGTFAAPDDFSSRLAVAATAVAAYLVRVSGDREVLLRIASAARPVGFDASCGALADPVLLRIEVGEGDTFTTLGRRVTAELTECLQHARGCPGDRGVPAITLHVGAPGGPRFGDVEAAVRTVPAATLMEGDGGRGDLRDTLGFELADFSGASTEVAIDFHRATFAPELRERAAAHFTRVLEALATTPDGRVDGFALVDAAERRTIVARSRGADAGGPAADLVAAISSQAARRPAKVAVTGPDATLTYGELEARSSALARRLAALGVRRESRVGVAVPRGAGELIALLATLKAGGAYVPVDPSHPMERVRLILEDARPEVLVAPTGSPLMTAVPTGTKLLAFDDVRLATDGFDGSPFSAPASPDQLAYVLFTSGSTGRPKGVEVLRGGVANFMRSMAHTPGLRDTDRLLAITTTTFDISGLELFLPLWVGGEVVIADRETAADPGLLRERLEAERFTCMQATPATWRLLIDAEWAGDGRLRMFCGGEALSAELATKLLERGAELWNLYGPTETTIWSTVDRVEPGGPITIGRPIDRTNVYVLDPGLQLVPTGVAGELWIGGDGLARGYLGRPDLTSERFIADPNGSPGERMYRTGDLGRLLPDGRIECLGRVDHQVKIRGFRIELGEIESVLRTVDGVKDAVVVANLDARGETRLVAYVVGDAERSTLVERARGRLPSYMVPSAYVSLPALPLTTSGKVDRKALPKPEEVPAAPPARKPPGNEAESRIAVIVQELLGTPAVGVDEDFFAAGGTSLLALQLRARIEKQLGAAPALAAFFETPTIEALARALPSVPALVSGDDAPLPDEPAGTDAPSVPRQFWLLQRLAPATCAYHIPSVFRVRGSLDCGALEAAFRDVAALHSAMRTTYVEHADGVRQVVRADVAVDFRCVDGPAAPEGEAVQAEIRRPFDLARGPLSRLRVWRNGADDHVIAWTMHHAVTDLATKSILARTLATRYAAHVRGEAGDATPDAADAQHATVAQWEREWLASDAARRAEEYFAAHLTPLPAPLALPQDRPRPAVQSVRGARVTFDLGAGLASRLEQACEEWQTKPFLVLFTAWSLLLSRYGDEERIAIGVPFSNRRRESVQATAGCFVNTLPLVVDRSGDPSFVELVRRNRASFLGHHRHQELPLERIVARSRPPRDPSRNALFQAGFTFEPPMALSLVGADVTACKVHAGGAQLDVFLTLWEGAGGFTGQIEYCTDLFEEATIQRLARNYEALLEAALDPVAARTVPVSRLDVLHPAERKSLQAWNATDLPLDGPHRLDLLFLAQVERSPDAVAVRMGDRRWSYRELAGHAGAVAAELRARGVGPGDCVGVYMERSLELIAAVYGTVLAGAAWCPLEPDYPAHRLALMLNDARPRCILTHDPVSARWSAGAAVPLVPVGPGGALTFPDASVRSRAAGDPAYVIFTSGSTGGPKGVVNAHGGIANRILWMQRAFGLGPADVVLHKTPIGFDVSVWELFWPLCVGAQLEIAPPGLHADPGALGDLIRAAGVTTLHFVPSMLQAFLDDADPRSCRSVKRIICSGEALGTDLVQRCCSTIDAELHNLYGPTEAAVDVTWWPCRSNVARNPVPIGRPIANTRVYVLDRARMPLPIGAAGELHIGGVQVALGYLRRDDLTRDRFVPDPFAGGDARLYRTGDRARWNDDGTIEFLGRIDHQVKIRGLRVELGEIDAALEEHPGVRQAVVVARHAGTRDAQLVAFVRPHQPAAPALAESLRARLADRLPHFMIPQQFTIVDRLPLSASGKVDRRALSEVPGVAPGPDARPQDDVSRWLLGQCEDLLGHRIGVRENLFDAGVTSLTAAQLITRVRRRFGGDVPLVRVFEHPTVEALAAHLSARTAPPPARPATPEKPADADPLAAVRNRAERRLGRPARPR